MNGKGRLVLLAALAVAAYFAATLSCGREPRVVPLDDSQNATAPEAPRTPVTLDATAGSTATGPAPSPVSIDSDRIIDGPALRGTVVDSATGHAIASASIEASAARVTPGSIARPRRPAGAAGEPSTSGPVARSTSDPTGQFAIPWSADRPADLRITADGHLDELRPAVDVGAELRISLRAGSPIRGRVHRGDGVGVEGAVVRADSIPRDAGTRGSRVASNTRTDGTGSFDVLGLPGVSSLIVVTHADFMPASARGAPEAGPLTVVMVPALKTWLRVRSSDGGPVSAPVVQWSRTGTAGTPLGVGVVDLSIDGRDTDANSPDAGRRDHDGYGPVKVPCVPSDGTVQFTVRVAGRLPWTSDPLPVPAGGGERVLDVTLERDPGVGSILVRLRDPEGRDLPFEPGEAAVTVRRTDGPALVPRGIDRDGAVAYDGLVAGTYEIRATARRFGASMVTLVVDGGRDARSDVLLTAPTSLRVRADAGPRRRVQFQVLHAGNPVAAFEEALERAGGSDADKSLTHFFAGPEGTLLRGLGAGRHTVRVLSPDLVAADVDIELAAGGVGEVEIHAKPR